MEKAFVLARSISLLNFWIAAATTTTSVVVTTTITTTTWVGHERALGQDRPYFILNGVCQEADRIQDSDACSRMAKSMNIEYTTTNFEREVNWYPPGCSLAKERSGVTLVYNDFSHSLAICRKNVLCICYGARSTDTEAYLLKSKRCPTVKFGAVTQKDCFARAQQLALPMTKNKLRFVLKAKQYSRPGGCFYNGKRVVYNTRNHPNQRCSTKYPCICLRTAVDERSDPPVLAPVGAYTSNSDPCPTPISTATDCSAKAMALHLYVGDFIISPFPMDFDPEGCYKIGRVLYWNPYLAGEFGKKVKCDRHRMRCICKGNKATTPKPTRPPRVPPPRILSGDDRNFV